MILDALGQAWRAWAHLGAALDEEQWQCPTRLDGWQVRHVFAHCAPAPGMLRTLPEGERGTPDFTDAESLLAHLQRPGGIAHQRAGDIRQEAITSADGQAHAELVAQFDVVAPDVLAELRTRDLTRHIDYGGLGTVPIAEALRIALMEAVVHYLDMADALDLEVPGPLAGLPVRDTATLLAGTADPVGFIELAAGRGSAEVFPVLR